MPAHLDERDYVSHQSRGLIHHKLVDTSYGMRLNDWTRVAKELDELGNENTQTLTQLIRAKLVRTIFTDLMQCTESAL